MRQVKQNTMKDSQEKATDRKTEAERERQTDGKRERKREAHTLTRSSQTLTHYYKRTFLFTLRYSIPFMIKKKRNK